MTEIYGILRQWESGRSLRAIKAGLGTTDCDACEAGPGAQGWRSVTDYPGNAAVTSKVRVGRHNVSKGAMWEHCERHKEILKEWLEDGLQPPL